MLIMCISVLSVILVLIAILWIICRSCPKVKGWLLIIWRKIFWNTIIRTILESSLGLLLGSMIKTGLLSTDGALQIFYSILTIAQIALIVVLAVTIPIFLYFKNNVLEEKAFIEKYGTLTMNMHRRDYGHKLYYTFFLSRRLILAALITYCSDLPNVQIMVITFATSI